jgi:chemotaxis protein methyltransferase CheR
MTLSAGDFAYVRDLMQTDSANRIDDGKEYLVAARLAPVASDHGFESLTALLAAVRRGDRALRDEVVEAMTINETSFFRDAHIFATLRTAIIPELLTASPRLRIWSAAAATGQEPYSLAMMMADDFPSALPPAILATDYSSRALQRGRAGRYTQLEVNRGLPARSLVRHFTQDGRDWQIDPRLRGQVTFRRLNLALPLASVGPQDLVLLRNVLIYFDDATRAQVVERVVDRLRPGGYLVLGSAEVLLGNSAPIERVTLGRTLCYRAV